MSRVVRGLLLTIGFYSFLACAYVVARVMLHDIDPGDMFIDGIPISFWALGIATFAIGVLCVLASLISVSVDRRSHSEQGGVSDSSTAHLPRNGNEIGDQGCINLQHRPTIGSFSPVI